MIMLLLSLLLMMMKMIVMMIMVMMMLMMILQSMMMHVYNGNYDDDANYYISIRIYLTVYPIQRCHQHIVVVSFVKLLRKNP
jgi:hypothetical protein